MRPCSACLQLTHTKKESESAPRWSPDGRYLSFLVSRGDDDAKSQVWLLVIYPGQYHGLTKPSYRKDRHERCIAWFDRFLKDAE